MTQKARLIWETSKVFCPDVGPDHPRRVTSPIKMQEEVRGRPDLTTALVNGTDAGKPGYVSTYSFPRGHTDDGENIPEINTIFVDFDIPSDSEYRAGDGTLNEWKRSMSDLLVRVQMVADQLLESGKAKHWRASLSGHKGVHLFFDFEPLNPGNGSFVQFKNGLKEYGDGMIDQLDEIAGGINIDPWVDVDSTDLARLVRHPNTPHNGASHTDDTRWCVPVTIEELSTIDPETYLELTSEPRDVSWYERNPSEEGRREIALAIRNAGGTASYTRQQRKIKDPQAVREYKEESNDRITVSDIPILVSGKPCIMNFIERDDGFNHGQASREMEINIIKELVANHDVPMDVIVDFFRPVPGWDEDYSRDLVEDIISRYDGPFVCRNIWENAPQFCSAMNGEEDCHIYDTANQ